MQFLRQISIIFTNGIKHLVLIKETGRSLICIHNSDYWQVFKLVKRIMNIAIYIRPHVNVVCLYGNCEGVPLTTMKAYGEMEV